jgi:hypothetical protein
MTPQQKFKTGKGKAIPVQAVESLRVARGWVSHNLRTFGSQIAASLSVLCAGHFLTSRTFQILIFVRDWADPRAIVRLEKLGKLEKSTSSGTQTGDPTGLCRSIWNRFPYKNPFQLWSRCYRSHQEP